MDCQYKPLYHIPYVHVNDCAVALSCLWARGQKPLFDSLCEFTERSVQQQAGCGLALSSPPSLAQGLPNHAMPSFYKCDQIILALLWELPAGPVLRTE